MKTFQFPAIMISSMAIATGVAGFIALIFIGLFFSIGGSFGTLNDIFNGLTAVLSILLAWMLFTNYQGKSIGSSLIFLVVAVIGTILAIVGSVLVISGKTGWYLAGLFTATGFGLIGLWLLRLNYAALRSNSLPQGLVILGIVCAVIMAIGLAGIPGMIRGTDINNYFPFTINSLWQLAFLGIYVLYPIWCIWLGRILTLK